MSKQTPQKSRLGRGLNSLMNLSGGAVEPSTVHAVRDAAAAGSTQASDTSPPPIGIRVLEVPIDHVIPNPHQPRRRFNEQALTELADSLRTTGMIQPIVVRGTSDGRFELIAGERRWRAARIAGLAALPVIVRSVDPVMQAQMALVENLQREDLNPIDRAAAYKALLDNLGLTHVELADRLGEDRSVIGHHMRLLDLSPAVQDMVAEGRLSSSHGRALAALTDVTEQTRLANLALTQGLSVKNLERLVSGGATSTAKASSAKVSSPAHLADLEKSLSRQLGMRIQVKSGRQKGKGRIVLHFATLDQFDDVMAKLGLSTE